MRVGRDSAGAASLVIVTIARAYVAKGMYRGQGKLDIGALRLIGRSSVDEYLVVDERFKIERPESGECRV